MKLKFAFGCFVVAMLLLVFIAPTAQTLGQNSKRATSSAAAETDWVKEIEPGIRQYGRVPPFGEVGQSHSFDVSPDGQTIAFAVGTEIVFWNIEDEKVEHRVELMSLTTVLEYSPDGMKLLISSQPTVSLKEPGPSPVQPGNSVIVWDPINHEKFSEITNEQVSEIDPAATDQIYTVDSSGRMQAHMPPIRQLAFSPDGDVVAIGFGQKTQIHDVGSGDRICEINHGQFAQSVAFTRNGKQVVDTLGKSFDANTGQESDKLPAPLSGKYFNSMRVNPRRDVIAATSWNQGIMAYDLAGKKQLKLEEPRGNPKQMFGVEFSNNGRYVAAATSAQLDSVRAKLFIWDLDSGKLVNQVEVHGRNVVQMRFSADNSTLFTKSHGELGISEWQVEPDQDGESEDLIGNYSPITQFQFLADGKSILASSVLGNSVVYELESGKPLQHIYSPQTSFLDSTSNHRHVILGAMYNSLSIYNCEVKKSKTIAIRSYTPPSPVTRLAGFLKGDSNLVHQNFVVNSAIVADDDEHFLIAMRSQDCFRWEKFELDSGRSVAQKRFRMKDFWNTEGDQQKQYKLYWQERTTTIAPNGQWLAIVNEDNDLFVVDAESGVLLHHLEKVGGTTCRIYFSPDSSTIWVVNDRTICSWDMDSGAETGLPIKMEWQSSAVAVNRKGNRLAALSYTETPRMTVFNLDNGEEVFSTILRGGYTGIGISDDGQLVALAKDNCQFEVFDLNELIER